MWREAVKVRIIGVWARMHSSCRSIIALNMWFPLCQIEGGALCCSRLRCTHCRDPKQGEYMAEAFDVPTSESHSMVIMDAFETA